MSSFTDVIDGEPIVLKYHRVDGKKIASMNLACCDCGLVHNVAIAPMSSRLKTYMWRDNKRTANLRRRKEAFVCSKKKRRKV